MAGGSLVVTTCAVVALAVNSAGCVSGDCGEGTVRYGNTCVAIDPFDKTPPQIAIDPPLHAREVGIVRLTADEPATIYYTIDGSQPTTESAHESEQVLIAGVPDDAQLRYFAIDLAGNQSEEGSRVWIIDRDGPGAPLDFKVTLSGATRDVSWRPPPDPRFGGVLVARVEGQLATSPTSGDKYQVGDELSPGVTVVHTSDGPGAATFSESRPSQPGLVRYVAWAFDNLHNYGPPAGDYVVVPAPPQTGGITINAATGEVAATLVPSHARFTGSATLVGTTLTLTLTVRNDTSRVLFAPKVLLTGPLTGGTWANIDGTFETFPYRAYGAAILPGTSATRAWTINGVAGDAMLTMGLDLRDGHVLTATTQDDASAGRLVDLATGGLVQTVDAGPTGPSGRSVTQRGGITPDGRLIVGARTAGTVSSFDLATGRRLLTAELRPQKAHVPQVILDRTGAAAYALIAEGHPFRNNNSGTGTGSETALVRLDAATLTENGRLPLDLSRNRDVALSPDGKTLLIATGVTAKGVIVVDLPTFAIKTRIMPGFRPQCVVFSPDGASIAIVGEQIAIYSVADLSRTSVFTTPGVNGKVVRAVFGDPQTLWIGRRNDSATIDLTTGATSLFATLPGRMLEVFDGKVYAGANSQVQRVSRTGLVEATITISSLRGHWLGRSPF